MIVSCQSESEFKKNRQKAILDGMQELKVSHLSKLGIFSDAKATEILVKSLKEAEKQAKKLTNKLALALDNPGKHDPVFKSCQRLFRKSDSLNLTAENKLAKQIRRRAFNRFMHGLPPRKRDDTSFGDGFNWEWMLYCAKEHNADLYIVSRDSDYGALFAGKSYVNDFLKQEFSERVGSRRKVFLFTKFSDALKHFEIPITQQEEAVEDQLILESGEKQELSSAVRSDMTSMQLLIESARQRILANDRLWTLESRVRPILLDMIEKTD